MAVAALRAAVLKSWLPRTVPAVVFVALTCLAVPVAVHEHRTADRQAARNAVLSAARLEVSDLMNIDYRTAGRDLERIVHGATGRLAELFAAQSAQLDLLRRDQSVTTGSVLAAGLLRLDLPGRVARVDVAADASVTDAQHPQPVVKHYRWFVTLLNVHGKWLVSDAALAGVPQ